MENNTAAVTFDLGEENEVAPKPEEVLDLGEPASNALHNPEYAKKKAEKTALGIGADPEAILKQFQNGSEAAVRQAAASQEALAQRQTKHQMLIEAASKLNRPLTEEDLNQFDTFSKLEPNVDPETVLEEAYGKAFSNFLIHGQKGQDVKQEVMKTVPEATLDTLDATGQIIAKREVTSDILQELNQAFEQKAEGFTVGNLGIAMAKGVGNALTFGKAFNNNEAGSFSLIGDYAKMFLPAYTNLKLGGLAVNLGDSLEDQYTAFMLMPPSRFKKEFKATVDALARDNLPLAQQYVQGFMSYSKTDSGLDTWFGYADFMGAAFTGIAAAKVAKNAGKARLSTRKEIQDFLDNMKATDKGAKIRRDTWNALRQDQKLLEGPKAGFDGDSIDEEELARAFGTTDEALPVPLKTDKEKVQDAKDFVNKAKDYARAATEDTPEEALAQMGEIDAVAARTAHKEMVGSFNKIDPFDDGVDLKNKVQSVFYPHEVGSNAGSLSVPAKDRLVAHGTVHATRMLQILTNNHGVTRLTDEQLAESINRNKEQMLGQYHGVNDAILDVDHGGGFVVWTPEQLAINNHILEMRLGALPEPQKAPEKPAPPKPPKMPQATGDSFLDLVQGATANKDRILARDLYDQLKREGKFTGNLAEFRKEVERLRKAKKLSLSPHGDALPGMSPKQKPKNVAQSAPKPVETIDTKELFPQNTAMNRLANTLVEDGRYYDYAEIKEFHNEDALKKELDSLRADDETDTFKGKTDNEVIAFKVNDDKSWFADSLTDMLRAINTKSNKPITSNQVAKVRQWLTDPTPKGALQPKQQELPLDIGEEGNYASEFARDMGYGNTSYRNRIIDSEFIVKPRGKYNSPVRAHYIDPPKGFEPKAKTEATGFVGYTPAKPTTDGELWEAINSLMGKVAQTGNNDLWHKLSKFLEKVEARRIGGADPGVDNRQLPTEMLGSPYGERPSLADDVEMRTQRVNPKTKKMEDFRQATPVEGDIITGRKGRKGLSFVGRQYTKEDDPSFYIEKGKVKGGSALDASDINRYAKLEAQAYALINKFATSNKVAYQVKIGKPTAQLFKRRDQAAYYGTNVYGLSPNQFRVLQQGDGYYISISKILDETFSSARDLQITTNNKSTDKFLDAIFGTGLSPNVYMSDLSRINRKTVTYGPQEQHRIIQESAVALTSLDGPARDEMREILIANRDFKYTDENGDVRRGRFNNTFGDFEREFQDRFRKLPTETQTAAYFEYVRLYELDLAMRDLALVRDMGRLGLERTTIGHHLVTEAGPVRKQTRAFSSREIEKLPTEDPDGEEWTVFVYDPHQKKGELFLRRDITKDVLDDINTKVDSHGFKILELGNPLEKPLRGAAQSDEIINFVVVKDFEKRKYDWSNIPKRPGGHVVYQDPFFISQPIIRRSDRTGTLRHIYEGDEHLVNLTTEAQAKKLLPEIEIARKLLKEGRMDDLEVHLSKKTPFETDQFIAWFSPSVDKDGNSRPPKFNIDDEFTWRSNGRNTLDMAHSKDIERKYSNFVNSIRSKYNLFASNVDKKFLGQRDPDLPAVTEYSLPDKEPAMTLTSPRLIDPFETINSSLANVIRSKYLNDLKTQAAENFIQEFYPVMKTPLEEMRRNPVFYLHNPVWDNSTDNLPKILMGKHVRQAHLHMIGTETTIGKALSWTYGKVTDSIYERLGQDTAERFTEKFRNWDNPIDSLRAMTFHTKLGLWNVAQAFKQSIHLTNIAAIEGPGAAWNAIPQSMAARWLSLTEDTNAIAAVAKKFETDLKTLFPNFNAKHFMESYAELKRTGMYNVGGEYASRDDFFDPEVFKSGVGNFLDKGTFFFKEGERAQRLVSWFIAYDKWRAANPKKVMTNADRAMVLDRADLLTFRMSRDSNANIQSGSFALPTQFFSYRWRMAELLWGTQFTRGERARLVLANAALWGVPLGLGIGLVVDYYDDTRQAMLEHGVDMDNKAIQALHDGMVSVATSLITGEDYNVAKTYGPGGLNIVKELFTEEGKLLEFAMGATGSVVGDMLKTSHGAYDFVMHLADVNHEPPSAQDFVDFTKNVTTANNLVRAYYIANTKRYITKNENLIIDDATAMDALMTATFGLTPQRVGDTFLMLESMKDQKEAQEAAEKYVIKFVKRSLEDVTNNDMINAERNMKRAKAGLIASGLSHEKWAGILRKAYDGDKPLFEKALKDFVLTAPRSQKMNRAIQREERNTQ